MQLSDIRHWISTQETEFVEALKTLVNQNTFVSNHPMVDQGMDLLCNIAERLGLHSEVIKTRHRLIRSHSGKRPRVLLIAHIDTVHPTDGNFQHFEPLQEGFIRGPGIGDMKGGVLMGLWTMLAMRQLHPEADVQMIVSADEELASPSLRDWYLDNKVHADYALGLEPGFPQGPLSADVPMGVVYQRKGTTYFTFRVTGKAAHAGGAWEMGLSAIDAMARRIPRIHELSNFEKGTTTNVGVVRGGTTQNTVAELCEAEVNLRFFTQADGDELFQAVKDIVMTPVVFNPRLNQWEKTEIRDVGMMPPMEASPRNQIILDTVLEEAQRLGQNVIPIVRGGGSDANYVSASGVPSICGMGAPAEGIHTTDEKIHLPLLFRRLELLIATTYRLGTNQLPSAGEVS